MFADLGDVILELFAPLGFVTGDAEARYHVNHAARGAGDSLHTLGRGIRGHHQDRRKAEFVERRQPGFDFLDRPVGHDQPLDAGRGGLFEQFLQAETIQRVQVTHQDKGHFRVTCAYPFRQLEATPAPTPDPTPIDFYTLEYRQNYGLTAIDTLPAYAAGLSGEGQIVAVVDTGIDLNNTDLKNNISTQSIDLQSGTYAQVQDEYGHGTWVAGIIAAEKNDIGVHGVAYNAQIMAIRADNHVDCTDGCTFYDTIIADGVTYAVDNGAKVINISLGGDSDPSQKLKSALIYAVDQGVAVVIAAGNAADDGMGGYTPLPNPDPLAEFATNPSVKGGIIVAGASNQNNLLADFSDRAGDAQDVYVVAPGDNIRTTDLSSPLKGTHPLTQVYGTSVSTPHVAGALALLMEMFPNLTAKQAIQILLDTAKPLATGTADDYGQGLIDIGAAIQPIGTLSIASVSGGSLAVSGTLLSSPAMGNGLSDAVTGALAFDDYRRAYKAELSRHFAKPAGLFSLAGAADALTRQSTALELNNGDLRLGVTANDRGRTYASTSLERHALDNSARPDISFAGQVTPRLSLSFRSGGALGTSIAAGDGLALTGRGTDPASQLSAQGDRASFGYLISPATTLGAAVFTGERSTPEGLNRLRQTGEAMILQHRVSRALRLTAEAGYLHEDGSVLGMTGSGTFNAFDGADTDYVQLGGRLALGSLRLDGAYMLSRTKARLNRTSIFEDLTPLTADSWSLTLTDQRFSGAGHTFGLHVSQPMAVTSGAARLSIATGWQDGAPVYDSRIADLSVSARETSVELFHRYQGFGRVTLQSNFIYRQNPDNLAGTRDEAAVFVHLATPL